MENDIIALYVLVDDFLIEMKKTKVCLDSEVRWEGQRGPSMRLSLAEVITLNLMRYFLRSVDLKSFHKLASYCFRRDFPMIPNYENFLKATNRSTPYIYMFLSVLIAINASKYSKYHYGDSTKLPVCKNHSISTHKVAAGFASRGKTSQGWFYGFKLHGICNENGELESICFTPGNEHDSTMIEKILSNINGSIAFDAGYLVSKERLAALISAGKRLIIGIRNNMKKIASLHEITELKKRSIIETQWGVLKERYLLTTEYARSMTGLFRHYFYSLTSFVLKGCFSF